MVPNFAFPDLASSLLLLLPFHSFPFLPFRPSLTASVTTPTVRRWCSHASRRWSGWRVGWTARNGVYLATAACLARANLLPAFSVSLLPQPRPSGPTYGFHAHSMPARCGGDGRGPCLRVPLSHPARCRCDGAATCSPPCSLLYQLGLLGCLLGCMFLQGAYAARAAMPPPPHLIPFQPLALPSQCLLPSSLSPMLTLLILVARFCSMTSILGE